MPKYNSILMVQAAVVAPVVIPIERVLQDTCCIL